MRSASEYDTAVVKVVDETAEVIAADVVGVATAALVIVG
jgi:hypothetical protein